MRRTELDAPVPPLRASSLVVLTHRVDGDGPPLVLLNGGIMSLAAWQPFIASLSSDYRVVRCDFRGQPLTPGLYSDSLNEHAGGT